MDNSKSILADICQLSPEMYAKIREKNYDAVSLKSIYKKISTYNKSVTCKICSIDNTEQGGCKHRFVTQYNTLVMEDPQEVVGSITINDKEVDFDIAIVRVVKALLIIGVSRNEELAIRCREIIDRILVLGSSSSYVTVGAVKDRLFSTKEKVTGIEGELLSAIKEVL